MNTIGLIVKPGNKTADKLAHQIYKVSQDQQLTLLADTHAAQVLKLKASGIEKIVRQADPILILGGDGTMIGVARHVSNPSPLLIGVNFGNLGFLTEITPNECLKVLKQALNKKNHFNAAERSLLSCQTLRPRDRDFQPIFKSQAVNDVVIQKGTRDRLVDLDIKVDGEEVMRLRADGLIVSTPTGSTAYSLAAGGSIAHPTLPLHLLTPICPHSLTSRPLLLSQDSEIEIRLPNYSGEVSVIIDGQQSSVIKSGDKVIVTKSPNAVRFVHSGSESYFSILRRKLNWGIANQG